MGGKVGQEPMTTRVLLTGLAKRGGLDQEEQKEPSFEEEAMRKRGMTGAFLGSDIKPAILCNIRRWRLPLKHARAYLP